MMFRFETLVKGFICCLSLILLTPAFADDSESSRQPDVEAEMYKRVCAPGREETQKCKDLEQHIMARISGKKTSCANAESEYNAARGAFEGACGAFPDGPTTRAKMHGDVACTSAILKCQCRFKNLPVEDKNRLACSAGSDSSSGDQYDLQQAERQFQNCPNLAAKDIERLENELKERKKDLRELQKKLPELQDAASEAQSQGDEKAQAAQKQRVEAAKARNEAQKDARREKEDAQNQLAQQLLQLQEEITKLEEQRGEIRMQRTQASVRRIEAISTIDLNCHKSASDKVDELQKTRLALEQARGYNRGGFAQMLKSVGVSDREAWQNVAKKYYDWCIKSTPTRLAKKAANDIYETEQKGNDERDRDLTRKRSDIANRMAKIKSHNGCTGSASVDPGGESTESALCQAARRANEEALRIDQDYLNQLNQLNQQEAQAKMSGAQKGMAKNAAVAQAQSEITDENTRLRNLEQFLALKRRYSGGKRISDQDSKDAFTKFGDFISKAKELYRCQPVGTDQTLAAQACAKSNICLEAANFLYLVGSEEKSVVDKINSEWPRLNPGSSTVAPAHGIRENP